MSFTLVSSSCLFTAAGMVSSVLGLRAPPGPSQSCGSAHTRHAQEGCGNRGGILAGALVLRVEQSFQLPLEVRGSTVLLGGFERVHRRPVVLSELADELRRSAGEIERIGVSYERDL